MKQLRIIGILILMLTCTLTWGQKIVTPSYPRTVIIKHESINEDLIRINRIWNKSTYTIKLQYAPSLGADWTFILIEPDEDKTEPIYCSNYIVRYTSWEDKEKGVEYKTQVANAEWSIEKTRELYRTEHPNTEQPKPEAKPETNVKKPEAPAKEQKPNNNRNTTSKRGHVIPVEEGIKIFKDKWVDSKTWCRYYSKASIEADNAEIYAMIDSLGSPTEEYILKAQQTLKDKRYELKKERENMAEQVQERYINDYKTNPLEDPQAIKSGILKFLEERMQEREEALNRLESVLSGATEKKTSSTAPYIVGGGVIAILVILIVVFISLAKKKKNSSAVPGPQQSVAETETGDPDMIVVRKTTNTVLKKQNIDDVIDNDSYLKIESEEFADDSAVRYMYLKNSCIKEIYNLYAEDLRNPENPKEDGCMVLGRWVLDKESGKYDVTLEEIVLPGDDAVFKEFELNFGGKIKLKVSERLRKLRRDTGLQYDLTCWVHSHPGLGVFFSNSDTSVQMQLKHPTHPKFLTALVIDILTPEQETGIFTFKNDESINSKNDLLEMYSLEKLHNWAIESEKFGFKPEDHFDILAGAAGHRSECNAVHLNNSSVIDLCSMTNDARNGLIGWAHGYSLTRKGKEELIIKSISTSRKSNDSELLGCLVVGAHCSIPTIRKATAEYLENLDFVMFYSTSDGKVTLIPVTDGEICLDEKFYGIETLENLKIWTRRKR